MTSRGFTLIELLIVIAILSILSVLGLSNFRTARIKATDLNRKSDLQTIAKSLEAYAGDHRAYPIATNGKITCQPNITCNWGSPFTDGNTVYLAQLPGNASGSPYLYESDGVTYTLYTYLENTEDPNLIQITPAISCDSAICNYKITSTNK